MLSIVMQITVFRPLNLITQEQIMIKQFIFGIFAHLPAVAIGADL